MRLCTITEYWDGLLYTAYNVTARLKYWLLSPRKKAIYRRTKELKGKHQGKRCFVVMNGPSIRDLDLRFLKDEVVFTSNFFYRGALTPVVEPNYYCWTDKKALVTDETPQLVREIKEACPNAKLIFNCGGLEKIGVQENVYFTYCKHLPNLFGVRSDLGGLCSNFTNVSLYTINAAIYLGFTEIYLLGLDFTPGGFVHFYDEPGQSHGPDERNDKLNVVGLHWEYTKAHYEAYALNAHAKKKGVRIINLNPKSYMRAFEFGSVKELTKEAQYET